MTLYSANISL